MSISSPRFDLSRFIVSIKEQEVSIKTRNKTYRVKRKFVRVRVKRGKSKVVKGAFIAEERLFKRKDKRRLPIKKLSTLSIAEMFNKDIVERGFEKVEEHYPKTLERHLLFYTSRR